MCLLPPRHSASRQGSQHQQEDLGPRSGVQPQQAGGGGGGGSWPLPNPPAAAYLKTTVAMMQQRKPRESSYCNDR